MILLTLEVWIPLLEGRRQLGSEVNGGHNQQTDNRRGRCKMAHVESIQQSLFRNGVVTVRTPTMIPQPNVMAACRHQYHSK